jgi:hypothetical protein
MWAKSLRRFAELALRHEAATRKLTRDLIDKDKAPPKPPKSIPSLPRLHILIKNSSCDGMMTYMKNSLDKSLNDTLSMDGTAWAGAHQPDLGSIPARPFAWVTL